MSPTLAQLEPGQPIRIVQTINRREGAWQKEVSGTLLEVLDAPTGSWYAHGEQDRYWLRRLRIKKACGEVTLVSLAPDAKVYLD